MGIRSIEFRGKRTDNGEWVEGDLFRVFDDGFFITDGKCHSERIDPETVGQYTGLTDKNGNRIFEGDVVEGTAYTTKRRGVIIWIDTIAGFGVRYFPRHTPTAWENSSILKQIQEGKTDEFAAEVIGNIHDNPELLEGA